MGEIDREAVVAGGVEEDALAVDGVVEVVDAAVVVVAQMAVVAAEEVVVEDTEAWIGVVVAFVQEAAASGRSDRRT
jgi:hypothetical protein